MDEAYEVELYLPIQGIHSAQAFEDLERSLLSLPGMHSVSSQPESAVAILSYDPDDLNIDQIWKVVFDSGYKIPAAEVFLQVTGLNCEGRIASLEAAVLDVPGILSLMVKPSLGLAMIRYIPGATTVGKIKQAMQRVKFEVIEQKLFSQAEPRREDSQGVTAQQYTPAFIITAVIGMLILLGTFLFILRLV